MNSKKSWQILIGDSAKKHLFRTQRRDLTRISGAIDQMEENPFGGDVVKLVGRENTWRRRVGNYRIIFEVNLDKRLVYIYEIKRRTSSTY